MRCASLGSILAFGLAVLCSSVMVASASEEMAYVGHLRDGTGPVSGAVFLKVAITQAGQTIWSNDGSSLSGEEPKGAVRVESNEGMLGLALGGPGTVPVSEAVLSAVRDGKASLRVWVSKDGLEFVEGDGDVRLWRSEDSGASGTDGLRGTGPTMQEVYDNSTSAGPVTIWTQDGMPILVGGNDTGVSAVYVAGATGEAARYDGNLAVVDLTGTTFPTGWGSLAVKNGVNQGLAIEVDDTGTTGVTRVWTKGAGGLGGSKKLIIGTEDVHDILTIDNDGHVGIHSVDPDDELTIGPAPGEDDGKLSLESSSGAKWTLEAQGAAGQGAFGLRDGSTQEMVMHVNPTSYRFTVESLQVNERLEVHNLPSGDAEMDLISASGQDWRIACKNTGELLIWDATGQESGLSIDSVDHRVSVSVLEILGGSDLAEPFEGPAGVQIEPGTVVVLDEQSPGRVAISSQQNDRRVAGIVSGAGGLNPGLTLSQDEVAGNVPVALSGRVYVKADASLSPIYPGDLLTTSSTPGHAMKVTDYSASAGAILGKAMSTLEDGTGLVLMLVSLQ